MKKVKCLIIDDEPLARELIETHISRVDELTLVGSCASAIEASSLLNSEKVDLLFLDIEMPVLKGTEFYKSLHNKPQVIFTTAYREYAIDGFDLNAVDYLLKPIVFSRFFQAIQRVLASHSAQNQEGEPTQNKRSDERTGDYIFVREDRKQVKIQLDDILYARGLKDYVEVFTLGGKHTVKYKLGEITEHLGDNFMRVHRSYIVNLNQVTAFTKRDLEIGQIEVPIGDSYQDQIELVFQKT